MDQEKTKKAVEMSIDDPDRRIYLIRQLSEEEPAVVDDWAGIRVGDGTEEPGTAGSGDPRPVVRTFAFLDLCESTAYYEETGPREALAVVSEFRGIVRDVCAARGVRVAKWIGDGAMLVGVSSGPVIATCVEVCDIMGTKTLGARGGVATSIALPFDGDDYLGRGANFAARLCDMAEEGEVLCDMDCKESIPTWVACSRGRDVEVKGMGVYEVLALRHRC